MSLINAIQDEDTFYYGALDGESPIECRFSEMKMLNVFVAYFLTRPMMNISKGCITCQSLVYPHVACH